MRCLRPIVFVLLPAIFMALSGCGGSSGSDSFNPVPAANTVSAPVPSSLSFSNISSAAGKYALSLSVDRTSIDANVGQVLATATLKSSSGATVSDRQITFSVAAGPASVAPELATVSTDSNGNAMTTIAPGNVLTTTNVILMATATFSGQTVRAYAPFQIVRGSGVITFISEKLASDPDGTLYTLGLDKKVEASFAGIRFEYMQQLPFQVTDANGNPRVGVPVTISIDNQLTGKAALTFKNPVVVTDSAGKGIFNVGIFMTAPPPGVTFTDSIIYQAVTTEATGTPSLLNYAGFVVALTTEANTVPLAISPSTASFGSGAEINLIITGGVKPYTVSNSNPTKISATLAPDGFSLSALLVDSSDWKENVTISVLDAKGNTASSTISRQ